jgi:hypothetical protein
MHDPIKMLGHDRTRDTTQHIISVMIQAWVDDPVQ